MVHFRAAAAVAILSASTVLAQSSSQAGNGAGGGTTCGAGNNCPSSIPCCSQYGACGVGAYCLGGCDPQYSFSLNSCVPAPVCKSQDYKLKSLDDIEANTKYLGDSTKAKWVSSGTPLMAPDNDSVILTLAEDGASASGTLLASSHYVWYGKVSASMKTSRGAGVVSAFILLSDVKDEIDFEFIGTDLETAQSNYYFQGITNYKQGKNLSLSSGGDTFSAWHTYEIDWQPNTLTWSVDGNVRRTLNKADTFNKTDNQYHYPQSPARVELSLWPAGLSKNGEGTVAWAGGLIDWNAQDPKTNSYYYAMYRDVNVQCYDAPSGANVSGTNSYIYTDRNGVQSSIATTNDATILKSLLGTGTDMNKDYPKSKPSGTKSASAVATSQVATVPGLTGAGPGTDGSRGGGSTGSSGNTGGGSGSGGSQSSSAAGSASTGIGGFTQGDPPSSKSYSGAPSKTEEVMRGSMFAVLVAFVGMLMM